MSDERASPNPQEILLTQMYNHAVTSGVPLDSPDEYAIPAPLSEAIEQWQAAGGNLDDSRRFLHGYIHTSHRAGSIPHRPESDHERRFFLSDFNEAPPRGALSVMHGNFLIAVRLLLAGLLLILAAGCSNEPNKYDFGISVAGGPTGWPVWVKELRFDNSWRSPAGSIAGGFDQNPPGGKLASLTSPKPIPRSVQAHWFSYRTQTFHQIDLQLPEDFPERVDNWYEEYPEPKYRHYFIVGFSGKGETLVWWEAFCSLCGYDRSQDFSTPIVENIKAKVVEGDPGRYRSQTEQFIDEGLFPAPSGFED